MADRKISQLTTMTTVTSEDLMLIVDDPNGTPANKSITVKRYFSSVPANTVFTARLTARANTTITCSNTVITSNVNFVGAGFTKANNFHMTVKSTPASNNATTAGYRTGSIFFSNTYIYIAVNATTLKRVAISAF